jgi:dephospho-CoA kinase
MVVVFLTGMSGTGKSTILKHLENGENYVVDLDYGHWIQYDTAIGDHKLDTSSVTELIESLTHQNIFLAGTAVNQREIYPYVDFVIILTAPINVMKKRLLQRTNNPFGQSEKEWQKIIQDKEEFEPLIIKGSDFVINTNRPLTEIIEEIYYHIK